MCTTRFNIKKFYIPPIQCASYGSQNKEGFFMFFLCSWIISLHKNLFPVR